MPQCEPGVGSNAICAQAPVQMDHQIYSQEGAVPRPPITTVGRHAFIDARGWGLTG